MLDFVSFDSKLLRSFRKLSWLLRRPYNSRRSFSIRALRFRSLSDGERRRRSACWSGGRFRSFRLTLCTSRPPEELDKLGELRSMTERERFRAPFPSPITPAFLKLARLRSSAGELAEGGLDEVEEARHSFLSHLAEMLAEEGKVGDLIDVEELLCHWSNLRSPAFVELVCSFYEQLCNDLFVSRDEDELLHDAI